MDCVTLTPDSISTVEHRENAQDIYVEMILKGKAVPFHVDSGATVNVLPAKYVGHKEINPTKVLQMWNKSELKPEGVKRVTIRNPRNDKKYSVEFVVMKEELTPLLGAKASQHMGLLEVHPENFVRVADVKQPSCGADKLKTTDLLIEEYQDAFEGELGTLPGAQRLGSRSRNIAKYITLETSTLSAEAETQARTREAHEIRCDITNGCTHRLGQQSCDCDKSIWRPEDLY